MVKVYNESNSHAELVAIFDTEETYIACYPALVKQAKDSRMTITESIEEYSQEEYDKEIALVSCIVREQGLLNGTLFQTFDKVYEIAQKYITVHGIDNNWEDQELDFDEHVIEFAKKEVSTGKYK